jgi:MFS family permease
MNLWSSLKGLPKNIWLICIVALINRAGTMVLPFLALYLTQEVGVEPGKAGLIITFYGIGSLISAPYSGKLSDKIGPLNVMKYSLLFSGGLFFVYSIFTNYYTLCIISVLLAIIAEAFRPAGMAFISNETSVTQRKPAYALYRLAINLGMSIGPVLGGLLSVINFHLLFYVDGITSIAAGIFLIFAQWEISRKSTEIKTQDEINILPKKKVWQDLRFTFFLISVLPVVMVFFQHFSSMPLFVVDHLGFARSTFGLLIAVNTILIIIAEVPLNAKMNNWENWKALTFGSILTAIGFGGMMFATEIWTLIITIIIWTFGEMIFFPAAAAYVAEISPEERRGEYMGYNQLMFSIAFTIAPWGGTKIYEIYGSQILWGITFFAGIISAVLIYSQKRLIKTKNV